MMMGIVLQLGIANAPGAERRPDPSLIACAEGDKQEGYEATKQGRKWERKKWRKFRQDEREYTEKTYQRGADGKKVTKTESKIYVICICICFMKAEGKKI